MQIRRHSASFLTPLLLATVAICPAKAHAQSTSADTLVVMVKRLSIVKGRDLDFGNIAVGNSPGTVTITYDGAVVNGGVVSVSGSPHAANFSGYGQYNRYISLRLDQAPIYVTRAGGSERMRVRDFTIASSPPTLLSTNAQYFRIGAPSGMFTFNVGATLDVGARQAPGVYQGTFTVMIQYF